MKVFRGPKTLPFWDFRHEPVSTVSAETLEASLKDGSYIRFNISKDAQERQAVCTVRFESEDIVPMISGLLSRLSTQHSALLIIKQITGNNEANSDTKLDQIREAISKL